MTLHILKVLILHFEELILHQNGLFWIDKYKSRTAKNNKNIILLNPFQPFAAFQIETRHLIFKANQMTGIYVKYRTGLEWVNFRIPKNSRNLG